MNVLKVVPPASSLYVKRLCHTTDGFRAFHPQASSFQLYSRVEFVPSSKSKHYFKKNFISNPFCLHPNSICKLDHFVPTGTPKQAPQKTLYQSVLCVLRGGYSCAWTKNRGEFVSVITPDIVRGEAERADLTPCKLTSSVVVLIKKEKKNRLVHRYY